MLSLSGIYGVYQYQKSAAPTPEEQSAQLEQDQKETANSRGAADRQKQKLKPKRMWSRSVRQNWQRQSRKIRRSRLHRLKMVRRGSAVLCELADGGELAAEEESVAAGSDLVEGKALTFSADNHLRWPVDGDVLLNYSMVKVSISPR